jgi:phospholipid/cholesterol/gamma-HCH transport system substrate-binding protein
MPQPEIAPQKSSDRQSAAVRRTTFLALAAVLLVAGALGINAYVETKRVKLYIQLPDADGLHGGSEVRLSGVKIGSVSRIRFLEFQKLESGTPLVEVELRVDRRLGGYLGGLFGGQDITALIHKNAVASVQTDGALADRTIDITPGTAAAPFIADGDRITGRVDPGLKSVALRQEAASKNMQVVGDIVERLQKRLQDGNGTLGAYLNRKTLQSSVTKLNAELDGLKADLTKKDGFTTLTGPEFRAKLERIQTLSDKLQADFNAGRGSAGRISSPDFKRRVTQVQESYERLGRRVAAVQKRYDEQSALGRFAKSDELRKHMRETRENMRKINERLDRGEGSAGKLLHDERLTDNMAQLTSELAKTVYDIRQSPFKYVRLRFSLF